MTTAQSRNVVGEALQRFEAALDAFDAMAAGVPGLKEDLFGDTSEWRNLLTYKLVPHLGGHGCLVVVVAGGTNTGKSSIFNLLLGETVSPVVNTAAATCHPVLAASADRARQCLEGKLVPEFDPKRLESPDAITDSSIPFDVLFVKETEALSDHLVFMDTPDVDSIDRRNWEVADNIRAAGDVLIAVVTGEKYKDERVVAFFRAAAASGRMILPVMNKANPGSDFEIARKQLEEFATDTRTQSASFVLAHDFDLGRKPDTRILPAAGTQDDLSAYIQQLDVPGIKQSVYQTTVSRFAELTETFFDRIRSSQAEIRGILDGFSALVEEAASEYQPAPGKAVGGLFHEFVQARRGPVRKYIGAASANFARGISAAGRHLTSQLRRRSTLESEEETAERALHEFHRRAIMRIARNLGAAALERSRALRNPIAPPVTACFESMDMDTAVDAVVRETLAHEDVSEDFREHANKTLAAWWDDHKGRRRALEALDTVLSVMPAAIAAPIAIYTGGLGVSEAVVVVGPLATQFVTRVMEYQFGDAMFDFLSPWRDEQRENLRHALDRHIVAPCLEHVQAARDTVHSDLVTEMRECQQTCLEASVAS